MQLLVITGPPAVGKMTVGARIAARSSFRLFHNHHTIEPLVEIFGHGTEPFTVLNSEFRRRVIEEAADHGLDLVFTFVWDMADPGDVLEVERLIEPYRRPGAQILVVELVAGLDTRLSRNRAESRLLAKPTKRDLDWSDADVRASAGRRLNTDPDRPDSSPADAVIARYPHLRLDTDSWSADQTADAVLAWLADQDRG